MSYHLSKYLLHRSPVFPANRYARPLETALQDPVFLAAIYLASPQFFAKLSKTGFALGQMTSKEVQALTRYYNRACYRATPFGYFASVQMGTWGEPAQGESTAPSSVLRVFIQPDEWNYQTMVQQLAGSDGPFNNYEPNPTLYRVSKYYRFIKQDIANDGHRTYQLQSSQYSMVLKALLKFCNDGRSKESILKQICADAHCTAIEGLEYFEFLTDAQILLPVIRPTITGFITLPDQSALQIEFWSFKNQAQIPEAKRLRELDQKVKSLLKGEQISEEKSALKTILVRQGLMEAVPESYQERLKQGIFALDRLCPADELPAMSAFKEGFRKHFEGERIPLLLALDPELGIGYQTEPFESPNPLLETVNIKPRSVKVNDRPWSAAHRYLMSAWLNMEQQQQNRIELDERGLLDLPEKEQNLTALGFSVLFSIHGDEVLIESAGGVNPAALIGRFTLADETILEAGRSMASAIEQLNPDLIFAEILHLADPHIDNVNRRAQLWSYQLPMLAGALNDREIESLRLDDLYVELAGKTVLLWSKRHKKYIIPRLSSAYNHSIDQLPLFRFLTDLSYQYSRNQLSFELMHFFPGFSFYPRVSYRQAIISHATWVLGSKDLAVMHKDDDWVRAFNTLADQLAIPNTFILSKGDQQLVFDRSNAEDLHLLKETAGLKTQVILREFLPVTQAAAVSSPADASYQVQLNAFMLPDLPLILPKSVTPSNTARNEKRKFIPGTEWLYLKLYVPRLAVNRLLLQLAPLTVKRFPNGRISQWFFIRYEDHAPHIRLRFKIIPEDVDAILAALRSLLEENVRQHLIREYQLDVYSRELERYEMIGMAATEEFFWYSSSFALQHLRATKAGTAVPTFMAAALTVKLITEGFYPSAVQQYDFWNQAYESFLTEFEGKRLKADLDQKYRETSRSLDDVLLKKQPFEDKKLSYWFNKIRLKAAEFGGQLEEQDGKKDYLLSVIHMHLNRMFTDQQRQQEMVIYYLLAKWIRSQMARQKQAFRQNDPS